MLKESKHTNFILNEVGKGDFVTFMEIQRSRLLEKISAFLRTMNLHLNKLKVHCFRIPNTHCP